MAQPLIVDRARRTFRGQPTVQTTDPPRALSSLDEANGGTEPPEPGLGRRLFNVRTLLSFAFAFGLLAFLFSQADLDAGRVLATIARADPLSLVAAFFVYYLTFLFRGLRWQRMLRSAGIESPPRFGILGGIIFLSWFANCLLPAKLGDVYRAYLLRKRSGISLSRAGGTVVAERLIDFGFVLVVIGASALIAFRGRVPPAVLPFLEIGAAAVFAAGLALLVLRRWEAFVGRFVPTRFRGIYERFHEGALGAFGSYGWLLLYTPLGWLAEILRFWLVTRAIGLDLGGDVVQELAVSSFIALGSAFFTSAAPTPGGLGAAELAIVGALALFGISGEVAVATALLDRMISYWSLVIVGTIVYLAWGAHHPSGVRRIEPPHPALGHARRD